MVRGLNGRCPNCPRLPSHPRLAGHDFCALLCSNVINYTKWSGFVHTLCSASAQEIQQKQLERTTPNAACCRVWWERLHSEICEQGLERPPWLLTLIPKKRCFRYVKKTQKQTVMKVKLLFAPSWLSPIIRLLLLQRDPVIFFLYQPTI